MSGERGWPLALTAGRLVAIVTLCLAATGTLEMSDYAVLRWVVLVVGLLGVAVMSRQRLWGWTAAYAAMVVIYNPIRHIHLTLNLWMGLDVLAAAMLGASFAAPRRR